MFPHDLNELFPKEAGKTENRILPINGDKLNVTVTCVGSKKYSLLVTSQNSGKKLLEKSGLQEGVIQLNWRLFREGDFQEIP